MERNEESGTGLLDLLERFPTQQESVMNIQELQQQLDQLEEEQALNEFGSSAYDAWDLKIQELRWQIDKMVDRLDS